MTDKPLLYIKNVNYDTPGSLGDFSVRWNIPHQVIDYSRSDRVPPERIEDYSAFIILGGPYHIYQAKERHPFLLEEMELLNILAERQRPVLGVCLGCQLLALALGGRVYRHSRAEIGCHQATLNRMGVADPLFSSFPNPFSTFHWHNDTFNLPPGAVHLAESAIAQNQAFRFGERVYGVQFHPEITRETLDDWIRMYGGALEEKGFSPRKMSAEFNEHEAEYYRLSSLILENFFRIAGIL